MHSKSATVSASLRRHRTRASWVGLASVSATVAFALASAYSANAGAQIRSCDATPKPPFCSAPPGDRAEGYLRQTRSEVVARNGMVATSQALAAQAGLTLLQQGGNAIDAAIAAAAVLTLVEPTSTSVGSDVFAVIYIASENKLHFLNASGTAPSGATLQRYNELGYFWNPNNFAFGSGMPGGILSVTVPGAAWGWDEMERKYGKLSLKESLQPAVDYATNGVPIQERVANFRMPNALGPDPSSPRNCCTQQDPDSLAVWQPFNGKGPALGQAFTNPDLAKTFRLMQQYGRDVFYNGEIAHAIVAKSNALGGTMTLDDLANYKGEWVEGATTNYHGYDVWELPPPSQAWNALEILNILEVCVPQWTGGPSLADLGPTSPLYWHLMIEAKKLGYADLTFYNADPDFEAIPLAKLLSKSYAATLCPKVSPTQASATQPGPADIGGTIVMSTADRWGNMVAFVNSNWTSFGSGITVPGYGFLLHSRARQFTLDPHSPNVIEPHKRPYNTLASGFVMKDGQPLMTIGLMGGDMQAQGHAQTLVNIIDLGANLQAATDMARFHHDQVANQVDLESQLFNLVSGPLKSMGHKAVTSNGGNVGGFQAIMFTADPNAAQAPGGPGNACNGPAAQFNPKCPLQPIKGFYRAGSDHRKDGAAVGY
ncbi:MAG TPA: gamma-glutamyltransferase family protein [Casimicrobiaceae bacterium]|nr:gamma-glutamyltransferase family protein [Casimicrobiaceae bacterium]